VDGKDKKRIEEGSMKKKEREDVILLEGEGLEEEDGRKE
jgi:hypothetical protein